MISESSPIILRLLRHWKVRFKSLLQKCATGFLEPAVACRGIFCSAYLPAVCVALEGGDRRTSLEAR